MECGVADEGPAAPDGLSEESAELHEPNERSHGLVVFHHRANDFGFGRWPTLDSLAAQWRPVYFDPSMLDVALIVPFQPSGTAWVEPGIRGAFGEAKYIAIQARDRLFSYLGLTGQVTERPGAPRLRSLTAVALSTCLERARLRWRTLDPGDVSLAGWRERLRALRDDRPRLVAISSTFVTDGFWLGSLCHLVRTLLPDAKIVVGGYFYATNSKAFLALDADILCVGEGEVRIVSVTEAVRDGRPLDGIPGLYLRSSRGQLRYTGHADPLRLDDVPRPDWSLSTRIEPSMDPEREPLLYSVETQRGCVFKCDFCTFRTLAAPVLGGTERAVAAIRDVADRTGRAWIVDATATYPRARWREIMEQVIVAGGSSIPLSVFARITDLDDEVCSLMAKAGVRYVYIGQESGDQRMLNVMRKGTKIQDLRPALRSLAKNGIEATLSFLYGFPGENAESLATTRRLMATINDGHEGAPLVFRVLVQPFSAQDFAGVHRRDAVHGANHRYDYEMLDISPARAAEEALLTYIELSRKPHAPVTAFDQIVTPKQLYAQADVGFNDLDLFVFAKAFDRGMGLFAQAEMDGTPPDYAALRRVKETILPRIACELRSANPVRKAWHRATRRAVRATMKEWKGVHPAGVGPLTRLALGWEVARATRAPRTVLETMRRGRYPTLGFLEWNVGEERDAHAESLVRFGIATGNRRLLKVT